MAQVGVEPTPQAAFAASVPAAGGYYNGGDAITPKPTVFKRQALRERLTPNAHGVVLAMVGLPARGKSFISRKLQRFLQWRGVRTRTFNAGQYRRDAVAPERSGRSEFFDAANRDALLARDAAAFAALGDALAFLDTGGEVVILDATNSTVERRKRIVDGVRSHNSGYCVIFVEALVTDVELLSENCKGKVENSPDFAGVPADLALQDLQARIVKYEAVYETVQDDEAPSIKLYNLSSKVMANHCFGRVAKTILPYLMAIHIGCRPIWLVRAGAGKAAAPERAHFSSALTDGAQSFAISLAGFIRERTERYRQAVGKPHEPVQVVTSTMPRAVASVTLMGFEPEQTSALNALDKGAIGAGWWDVECCGDVPPWEEVGRRDPDFYEAFLQDPLRCRFTGGESYMDVSKRLEGVLIDVEMCTRPVLVVSHITVLQLLISYFRGLPVEDAWKLAVRKNTVLEVTPTSGGGFICEEYPLAGASPECVGMDCQE